MQTFHHNKDVTLKVWPTTAEEWESNPEVMFSVATDKPIQPKDRIFCTTKMLTGGMKSGSVVDIYYVIQDITNIAGKDVTAIVKRIEL